MLGILKRLVVHLTSYRPVPGKRVSGGTSMSVQSVRTGPQGTCLWKLSVLLLLVGLVSVSALAKKSFELPRSSPSHWVSQACKMREDGRAAPAHAGILRAVIAVFYRLQPPQTGMAVQSSDPPPALIPDFFGELTLRAPPVV